MSKLPKLIRFDTEHPGNQYAQATAGFVAIKTSSLNPQTVLPCGIYFPSLRQEDNEIRLKLILPEGRLYDQQLHDHLLREGIDELFIEEGQVAGLSDYVHQHTSRLLKSGGVPAETKTKLLYQNAELVVRRAFAESPSPATIRLGRELVENLSTHISLDQPSADALFSLFSKDYGTYTHCVQVALLGMSFTTYLGWSEREVNEFGLGALFHDVGKNRIPESILNKPGSLNEREYTAIKEHSFLGYSQLKATKMMTEEQLTVVLSHHEAANGSGYPHGLQGDEISRYARVARIVDCFDAMISNRPYKKAFSKEAALRIMKDELGLTFDSKLLRLFVRFVQGDPADTGPTTEELRFVPGCEMYVQCRGQDFRIKTTLLGIESRQCLIVRPPQLTRIQSYFMPDAPVTVRYLHAGAIYGFQARVRKYITDPLQLLFISYPRHIEIMNLRKTTRIACFLLATAEFQGRTYPGVVLDLSVGGCRFVMKHPGTAGAVAMQLDQGIAIQTELMGNRNKVVLRGKLRHVNLDENRIDLGIQFTDLGQDTLEELDRCVRQVLAVTPLPALEERAAPPPPAQA